tara:strand:- start:9 stop:338 length:330 start_codon:yes stop_codon:yes gene_type:complete
MKIAEPSDTRSVIKNNIDCFIDSHQTLSISNNNLSNDKKRLLEENEKLQNKIKILSKQVKGIAGQKIRIEREKYDMENKLIEATTPWYVKLKDKLPKFGIRNPFYLMQD